MNTSFTLSFCKFSVPERRFPCEKGVQDGARDRPPPQKQQLAAVFVRRCDFPSGGEAIGWVKKEEKKRRRLEESEKKVRSQQPGRLFALIGESPRKRRRSRRCDDRKKLIFWPGTVHETDGKKFARGCIYMISHDNFTNSLLSCGKSESSHNFPQHKKKTNN